LLQGSITQLLPSYGIKRRKLNNMPLKAATTTPLTAATTLRLGGDTSIADTKLAATYNG